jgi:hypothetical protein
VAKVPAIEPAVEIANSRPAVWPSVVSERARRRTAIGATPARTRLGAPKSAIAASSGLRRGPGSHSTIASNTGSSSTGIPSTNRDPRPITPASRLGVGSRSASQPPAQYPSASPASTTPISAPQTKSELPK